MELVTLSRREMKGFDEVLDVLKSVDPSWEVLSCCSVVCQSCQYDTRERSDLCLQ